MKINTRFKLRQVTFTVLIGFAATQHTISHADEMATSSDYTFMDAIQSGKNMSSFRLRYENVQQDGNAPAPLNTKPLADANAVTLRSLIGWQTAPFHNFSFAAQLINVGKLDEQYNDSTNNATNAASNQPNKLQYAKVVDPDMTDINQLYFDWTGIRNTRLRAGRQQVVLDNARFIGDVGFRQDMQVFDGASVINKTLPDTEVYLAYFNRVRQVNTRLRDDGALEVGNLKYRISPTESISAYGYFSDFTDLGFGNAWFGGTTNTNANQSNKILGLRLDGVHTINPDWKGLYTAEYAKQTDFSGGDSRIDAHYYKIGGGAAYNAFTLRLDQEMLSSNNGLYAFQTPFGSNHAFQGGLDKFLVTPKEGMVDTFATATYKYGDFQFFADYHVFNSDVDFNKVTGGKGDEYGTGWSSAVTYNYSKNILTKLEYAEFHESDQYQPTATVVQTSRFRNTDKLWLTAMYTF